MATACSSLPIENDLKTGHFRLENFELNKGKTNELVYLACFENRPLDWISGKQMPAGQYNLLVKAKVQAAKQLSSTRYAFVNFNVNLDSDKRYKINRKLEEDSIVIWIEDMNTKEIVSEYQRYDLNRTKASSLILVENNAKCLANK